MIFCYHQVLNLKQVTLGQIDQNLAIIETATIEWRKN